MQGQLVNSGLDFESLMQQHGQVVLYSKRTIDMVVLDSAYSADEISQVEESPFRYAYYEFESIPFILLEINEKDFQFYFNVFEVVQIDKRNWVNSYRGDASFVILDNHAHTELARRTIFFANDFLDRLKTCLARQLTEYTFGYDVAQKAIKHFDAVRLDEMKEKARPYKHR
jgi:hypothetical protein